MSKEKWVSLPHVAEATDGVIQFGYTGLPEAIHPEWLQANVHALKRGVIGWGGYTALTLAGRKGESDQISMSIGSDSAGNAYGAGSVSVAKAEKIESSTASDMELDLFDVRNGSLGVVWNTAALNSDLSLDQQYDPYLRARQLDSALRMSLVRSVVRHNTIDVVRNRPRFMNLLEGGLDALWLYSSDIPSKAITGEYVDIALELSWRSIIMQIVIRNANRLLVSSRVDGDLQYSDMITDPLLFSARPVRAGIAAATIMQSKLIRVQPL